MAIVFLRKNELIAKNQKRRRSGKYLDYGHLLQLLANAGHKHPKHGMATDSEHQQYKTSQQLKIELVEVVKDIVAAR